MTDSIRLEPRRLKPSSIALPGSKSISNRTLLLAALSDNGCTIRSLLQSDDTDRMLDALTALGVGIEPLSDGLIRIHGCGGRFPQREADLFLGNAGTAFRPLAAALAVLGGDYRLHGVARMHERPIGDLVDALRIIGADIRYTGNENYPPLHIGKRQDNGVRSVPVKGNVSSQFLTALLMALPLTGEAFEIQVEGELISKPYIDITLNMIKIFGVDVENQHYQRFIVKGKQSYQSPGSFLVEGDASSASYFLAAGAIKGKVKVTGIGKNSIQGDRLFADVLEKMGAKITWGADFIEAEQAPLHGVDMDMNHIPDAAMTIATTALFAEGETVIRNIYNWRVKETDRLTAMATELRKLGAEVIEEAEAIHITPPETLTPDAVIDTYDDHRMAMCFSLVSLLGVPVYINDPQCVNKTFPDYSRLFESMRA